MMRKVLSFVVAKLKLFFGLDSVVGKPCGWCKRRILKTTHAPIPLCTKCWEAIHEDEQVGQEYWRRRTDCDRYGLPLPHDTRKHLFAMAMEEFNVEAREWVRRIQADPAAIAQEWLEDAFKETNKIRLEIGRASFEGDERRVNELMPAFLAAVAKPGRGAGELQEAVLEYRDFERGLSEEDIRRNAAQRRRLREARLRGDAISVYTRPGGDS